MGTPKNPVFKEDVPLCHLMKGVPDPESRQSSGPVRSNGPVCTSTSRPLYSLSTAHLQERVAVHITIISNVGEMRDVGPAGGRGLMSVSKAQGSGQALPCRVKKAEECSAQLWSGAGLDLWLKNPSSRATGDR